MNPNIKALGLALVAALALTAVMASTASAQFTSNAEHTILSGSQTETHKFTPGSGTGAYTCSTVTFSGTSVNKTEGTQVLTPTYSGCKDSLGRSIDIFKNTMTYTFTSGFGGGTKGNVDLAGELIWTVTGGTHCTVTVSTQTNNGISYTNEAGKIRVTTNTTNLHSSLSGGFFACGTSSTTSSSGTYTGKSLIEGKAWVLSATSISSD